MLVSHKEQGLIELPPALSSEVHHFTLSKSKQQTNLIMLCSLNSLKEALFLLLAPFFPEQMRLKAVPELYYAPLFA